MDPCFDGDIAIFISSTSKEGTTAKSASIGLLDTLA